VQSSLNLRDPLAEILASGAPHGIHPTPRPQRGQFQGYDLDLLSGRTATARFLAAFLMPIRPYDSPAVVIRRVRCSRG